MVRVRKQTLYYSRKMHHYLQKNYVIVLLTSQNVFHFHTNRNAVSNYDDEDVDDKNHNESI